MGHDSREKMFCVLSSFFNDNQINARALIGQSAMALGAGKLMVKIARLLNCYIKAVNRPQVQLYGLCTG